MEFDMILRRLEISFQYHWHVPSAATRGQQLPLPLHRLKKQAATRFKWFLFFNYYYFYYVCRLDKWGVFVLVYQCSCCVRTCNEPSRYVLIPCTHSRGLMRFVARPRWWGWCMSTMTWGDAGWSFPWQIWMLCPPFTHQTGWDCLRVSSSKHWCLFSTRPHRFHSLQSIPENGSPEVSPDLTCTPQSAAQTPTSVPTQDASPPIQPGQGPASLSPQQVLLSNVSKLWIWIILECQWIMNIN